MRTIGVVSVARSDYGLYLPVLRKIVEDSDLRLHLMVSGTHLSPEFGLTAKAIEADGFEIDERIEMSLSSDTPEGIAKSMGLGVIGFAQAYARCRPDILLVLGDRYEMHAACVAAVPFRIPIAHIHGGEITEGAIDDVLRHSITKMSHLHFASTDLYAKRIIQMGEEPWRVVVSGAPSIDNLAGMELFDKVEVERRYELDPSLPTLLVTYHPVTLEYEDTQAQIDGLLKVLSKIKSNIVFTYPNADTSGRLIIREIEKFCSDHSRALALKNIGTQGYFSFMRNVAGMVGNSSSGIIEAASFKLPVVNIGSRQAGRMRAGNVIDVGYDQAAILTGIEKAMSEEFRSSLGNLVNPYGDGGAADKIVAVVKRTKLNDRLLVKRFCDLDLSPKEASC